ncbi:MAG: hypothetical protein E7256_05555 [Lachnospiraceae bacterium]|nr:hypothetical protein [Lachnospiraceae bacterium]
MIALLLAVSLVHTPINTVSAAANTILTDDKMQDTAIVSNAEENVTYYYDFINSSDLGLSKIEHTVYWWSMVM